MSCFKIFRHAFLFSFFFAVISSVCLVAEAGSLSGRVITSEGAVGVDAIVAAFDVQDQELMGYAFTDGEGQYQILDLEPGDYYLYTLNEEGYTDELYQDVPCSNQSCDLVDGTAVHVEEGIDTDGIDFELETGQLSISGQAMDQVSAGPIEGVEVDLYDSEGHYLALSVTGEDGTYFFYDLAPGSYYLTTFEAPSHYIDELYDDVSCPDGACDFSQGLLVRVTGGEGVGGINFYLEKSATITVTGDNSYVLYVNGVEMGRDDDWTTVESFSLPLEEGDSIALEVTDTGWIAGVACQIEKDGIVQKVTDFTWQVSTTFQGGWQAGDFDHSNWPGAKELYAMGGGPWGGGVSASFDAAAKWVWSEDEYNHDKIYLWTKYNPRQNGLLKVSADNRFLAYKNGGLLGTGGDWNQVKFFPLEIEEGDVIGIDAADEGGIAGLIGEIRWEALDGKRQSLVTDGSWRISQTAYADTSWAEQGYVEGAEWTLAVQEGALGVSPWGLSGNIGLIDSRAQWIWAQDRDSVNRISARKEISNAVLNYTADNACEIYLNGLLVSTSNDWTQGGSVGIELEDGDVIAVRATDTGGLAAFMASISYKGEVIVTNRSWKISKGSYTDLSWTQPGYDDAAWLQATAYGTNGINPWGTIEDVNANAQWIWSDNNDADNEVCLRFRIGDDNGTANLTTLELSTDDAFELYVNGTLILKGDKWYEGSQVTLPLEAGDVIAVKGIDGGYKAGFILSATGQYHFVSDTTWRVSTVAEPGWNIQGFNDSGWPFASDDGIYGTSPWGFNVSGFEDGTAHWIWTNRNQTGTSNIDTPVYFRKVVE